MDNGLPPLHSYGALLDMQFPEVEPVVDRIVDRGAGVIFAGAPAVGKTWWELVVARAVATGSTLVSHFTTSQGPVLIVDEESNIRRLQDRLWMLERGNPIGSDAPIHFVVGNGLRLDTPQGLYALDRLMAEVKPVITFFDSFTRIHGGNENDSGQMADVFRNAKQLMTAHGTAVAFLDHLRKKGLLNDREEMIRGSTEKRAWPDSILYLEGVDKNVIQVSQLKARFSEPVPDFRIRLHIDKDAGTAEVTYDGEAPAQETSKANELIGAIHSLQQQLGPDDADVTKLAAWLGCSPSTVQRHADKLVKAGIIAIRTVPPSEKGGRPKKVYDVKGGHDADDELGNLRRFPA